MVPTAGEIAMVPKRLYLYISQQLMKPHAMAPERKIINLLEQLNPKRSRYWASTSNNESYALPEPI